MLATESRGDGTFLEGIVDGVTDVSCHQLLAPESEASCKRTDVDLRRSEELFEYDVHAPEDLREQEVVTGLIHHALSLIKPFGTR